MQNKLMISIVDDEGSKQFSIHRVIKKVLFYLGVGIVVLLVSYLLMVKLLISELDSLIAEKNEVRNKFQEIYEKNNELARNVEYKTNELFKASSRINELEKIVNIYKNSDSLIDEQNYEIDLEDLSDIQKQIVLKIIPNGDPIRGYDWDKHANLQSKKAEAFFYEIPQGTPIYATANGIVDSISNAKGGTYGTYVKLAHSFGFTSVYAHLQKPLVQKGEFVIKGQLIGYSGQSGASKKEDLLYELRFLGSPLSTSEYARWDLSNFNAVTQNKDQIDWKSLVWALDDLAQLQSYRTAKADTNQNEIHQ
ncbi:M23 family peptidase [Helicobacter sp. MIT 00-7814]|uniref:M23 family metallopeptidase n=1 Tax=unclassified Helicobacter TaxID=2593540 RepID=UPI000E1EEB59|nr:MULTISPECIES: M23 family metallopeptidase [unclassified Helicobacter]RDU55015.1 M23 family peptidase [Helicobacter sp. MIT 00-7814]RDU55954.1 M23 family peptidase [Helicobacter sp. MIT 99-10781]